MLYVSCVLVMVLGTGNGAFLTPIAYGILNEVVAVNGSDANGGCPTPCAGVAEFRIETCDCGARSGLGAEATTGVLIDGVIPTIDTAERNTWAAPLFTIRRSALSLTFLFSARVILQEVELFLFHCPAWGIGAEKIRVHNGGTFPRSFKFNSIGSVTLASDENNCTSLTRVSVPLQMALNSQSYNILFVNPSGAQIEWVHVAEVRFSDQPNTSSATTTTENPAAPTSEVTEKVSEETSPATPAPDTTTHATTEDESTTPATAEDDITTPATAEDEITTPATTEDDITTPATAEDDITTHATAEDDITTPATAEDDITTPATAENDITTSEDDITTPATAQDMATSDLGAALGTTDGGTYCITPQTTPCTCSAAASSPTPSIIIIILAVVIAVLLCLLAVGGVLFLVCVLRAKSSRRERREGREGREEADREYDSINMKQNDAYGDVRGRGGEGPSGEERRAAKTDAEYEVVRYL